MFTKDESGFSLLEVVISFLILGIVLVPLMGLFFGSQQRYDRSTEGTIALNIAQQKMEEIVGADLGTYMENPETWIEFSELAGYYYQTDVTPPEVGSVLDKDKLNLYTIDVRVRYQAGGQPQNLSLSTYLVDK